MFRKPDIKSSGGKVLLEGFDGMADDSNSSLTHKALRSGVFVTVSKVIRYGFVFLTHLILMNILNPADFGMMRYVTIVLGLVNLINEAGLKLAIVQKKELEKNETASSFMLSILFSFLIYGIIYFVAPMIASYANNVSITSLIRVGGLAAPLGGVSIVQRGLMQRQFRFARLSLIDVVSACGGSITGLVVAFSGWGVWALVSSVVTYTALSSLLCIITTGVPAGNRLDFKSTISLLTFGSWDIGNKFIGYITMNVDYVIIGKYFGAKALGLYDFSFTMMLFMNSVFSIITNDIALSTYSRLQGDSKRTQSIFLKLTKTMTLFFVPVFIIIFLLAPDIVNAISFVKGNDKWIPAVPYILLLAPLGLLYTIGGFPAWVWTANGQNRVRTTWAIFSLVTIVVTLLIGAQFGIFAICKALLIRAIFLFPVGLVVNFKTFGVSPFQHIRALLPPLLCGVVTLLISFWVRKITFYNGPGDTYIHLLVNSIVIVMVYTITIWLFYRTIIDELKILLDETGLINKITLFLKKSG